jgi:hypothetical protein
MMNVLHEKLRSKQLASHIKVWLSHPANRMAAGLGFVFFIVSIGVLILLFIKKDLSVEQSIVVQDKSKVDLLSKNITNLKLMIGKIEENPSIKPLPDILGVINQKLLTGGYSEALMEIDPRPRKQAGQFSLDEVKLRLSPIPTEKLADLFILFEESVPSLRISHYELNRITQDQDGVNVMLILQRWTHRV